MLTAVDGGSFLLKSCVSWHRGDGDKGMGFHLRVLDFVSLDDSVICPDSFLLLFERGAGSVWL